MVIYLLYLCFCIITYGLLHKYYKRSSINKIFVIIAVIGLILIFGLRNISVGTDTIQYYNRYNMARHSSGLNIQQDEYGFNYINYLFNQMECSWQIYLFTINAIMLIILGMFIYKYSPYPLYSVIIFVCIGLFNMYMSGLRQSLAISLCIMSLCIIQSKLKFVIRFVLFAALVYAATTIHNSAFIFYPMALISHLRLNKKQVIILLVFSVLILTVAAPLSRIIEGFLPERYEDYTIIGANGTEYRQNPLVVIVLVVQTIFCIVFNNEYEDGTNRFTKETSTLFVMSSLTVLFGVMGLSSNQVGRMGYYFTNANAVLIPRTLSCMKKSYNSVCTILIVVFCILYFIISTPGGTLRIDNYRFFWQ